jgi:hypothetical protein
MMDVGFTLLIICSGRYPFSWGYAYTHAWQSVEPPYTNDTFSVGSLSLLTFPILAEMIYSDLFSVKTTVTLLINRRKLYICICSLSKDSKRLWNMGAVQWCKILADRMVASISSSSCCLCLSIITAHRMLPSDSRIISLFSSSPSLFSVIPPVSFQLPKPCSNCKCHLVYHFHFSTPPLSVHKKWLRDACQKPSLKL